MELLKPTCFSIQGLSPVARSCFAGKRDALTQREGKNLLHCDEVWFPPVVIVIQSEVVIVMGGKRVGGGFSENENIPYFFF